jgi:hypothetical protein
MSFVYDGCGGKITSDGVKDNSLFSADGNRESAGLSFQ